MKTTLELPPSILTKNQKKVFGPKVYIEHGQTYRIKAIVRYDDECGNGHNSFSITADIDLKKGNGRWEEYAGGCCHGEVEKHFPELAPFIKWHLTSSDGPMRYVQNTVYLAGERDCRGKLKGEPKDFETFIVFGENPIRHHYKERGFMEFLQQHAPAFDFEVLAIEHHRRGWLQIRTQVYTFGGFADKWHECPFDSEQEALDFLKALQTCSPRFVQCPTSWGEGKARELDAARHCAVWPDATDEDLTAPGLEQRLKDRLPALMAEFKAAVESLGFVY